MFSILPSQCIVGFILSWIHVLFQLNFEDIAIGHLPLHVYNEHPVYYLAKSTNARGSTEQVIYTMTGFL